MEHLRELRGCIEAPNESIVTVVGDVMLDRYVYGYANSLNSTAPVPILFETERQSHETSSESRAAHREKGGQAESM